MADLATQLRDYLDATTPQVSLSEVCGLRAVRPVSVPRRSEVDNRQPQAPSARKWWQQPPVVATAAAVVALILIGGVALFALHLSGGDDLLNQTTALVTSAIPPTTTAPSESTTASTTTTLSPTTTTLLQGQQGEAWGLGVGPSDAATGGLSAVTAIDAGFVAVGMAFGEADGRPDMIAWSSRDGVVWSREDPDQPALTIGSVVPYAVVDAGDLIVAGGLACDDPDERCPAKPALWTSPDAVVWERVPHDDALFGEAGSVNELELVGDQIIALGEICSPDPESLLCFPVVWQSEGGTSWSRAFDGPEADMVIINEGITARLQGAAAAPDGSLVIVGGWCDGDASTCTAAVWLRDSSGNWERVVHDPDVFRPGSFMMDVTSGPDGLVAVGIADLGDAAAIWTSPDGRSWTLVSDDGPTFERTGITSIIWAGDRYLAVGPGYQTSWCGGCFEGDGLEPCAVWTSADGRVWNRIDLDQRGLMLSMAIHSNRLVAVGTDWGGGRGLWVSPPPDEQ